METIKQILSYNLTPEEKESCLASGMINGCGADKGFSFDSFIKNNIQFLPNKDHTKENINPLYDPEKRKKLLQDLREICYEHDLDYRFQRWFYKSNIVMARKVYKLFHWLPFKYRFTVCSILLWGLNKYGKIPYKLSKKCVQR